MVLEPRGHADMVAAQLGEPAVPGAHASVIFMDRDGYRPFSGAGVIAAATMAIERGLFYARGADEQVVRLVFETPIGNVATSARVESRGERTRVDTVAFQNVPAFVVAGGHRVTVGARDVRVDVAFGGLFYAIVDTEAVGIPLVAERLPELRHLARKIASAVNESLRVRHPAMDHLAGVAGVVYTGPPQDPEAHLRALCVTGTGVANRSPGGTAMSAIMSVLDVMGLLPGDQPFVLEGLVGSLFRGRAVGRTVVGEHEAIATEIEGTAWITGEHTFHLDDDDPFREGIVV